MASYNKTILMGHLCRDWELRFTPKGTAVGSNSIAVNRKWKTETGDEKEEVTFVNLTAWNKSAETLGQYTRKGSALFVEGRLQSETWEDKTSGQKRSALKVVVESFQFLGGKPEGTEGAAPKERLPQTRKPQTDGGSGGGSHDYAPQPEDDVPF